MANVQIIHWTGQQIPIVDLPGRVYNYILYETNMETEYAARLLAFTKNTRLKMDPEGFEAFLTKPWQEIEAELDYMAGTIPSSWEFVDITFTLQGVSRACAQQITRTRFTPMDSDIFGSYAMQSMRVVEMTDIEFYVNPELPTDLQELIRGQQEQAANSYAWLINRGVPVQDARGVLPLDTHCNLVVKFNLRQLVDMLRTRDGSLRVQGEYGEIAHQMRELVHSIWPWADRFFEPKDKKAIDMIQDTAIELENLSGLTLEAEDKPSLKKMAVVLAKAADLLKK